MDKAVWAIGIWAATTLLSLAIVAAVAVTLPADYFTAGARRQKPRLALRIVRNAIGIILILLGVALSIPGVPGQGLLTLLMGLVLVEFPGRDRVERRILRQRGV